MLMFGDVLGVQKGQSLQGLQVKSVDDEMGGEGMPLGFLCCPGL